MLSSLRICYGFPDIADAVIRGLSFTGVDGLMRQCRGTGSSDGFRLQRRSRARDEMAEKRE